MLELFQNICAACVSNYDCIHLLGSISFSIIFYKKCSVKKIFSHYGSGNAGTTNVLRSVGGVAAILTFVLIYLKCVISVLLAKYICWDIFVQLVTHLST